MVGVARRIVADVALDAGATLGEGPTWDAAANELIWVDILRHLVHRFDPATGADGTIDVGRPVGAVARREGGGLVLALEDGFGLAGWDGNPVELVAPVVADDPTIRFNDGKCDPSGRFWAGTMAYDERVGARSLYRLGTDRRVEVVLEGITISKASRGHSICERCTSSTVRRGASTPSRTTRMRARSGTGGGSSTSPSPPGCPTA